MESRRPGHIFLMGFMGSGKSTIGRELAIKLELPFLDLDEYIESLEGCSIAQIFADKGERYFRMLEKVVLYYHSTQSSPSVVSLGGGTPCTDANIAMIQRCGDSFFLDVPKEVLIHRLQHDDTRPLLANKSRDELVDLIDVLLRDRYAYYRRASYTIHETDKKDTIEKIIHLLSAYE